MIMTKLVDCGGSPWVLASASFWSSKTARNYLCQEPHDGSVLNESRRAKATHQYDGYCNRPMAKRQHLEIQNETPDHARMNCERKYL